MDTMPVATYLAVEAVRRQYDPRAEPELAHDPLRLPRFRAARSALAAALHATARAVAPPPAPRLSSGACRG